MVARKKLRKQTDQKKKKHHGLQKIKIKNYGVKETLSSFIYLIRYEKARFRALHF